MLNKHIYLVKGKFLEGDYMILDNEAIKIDGISPNFPQEGSNFKQFKLKKVTTLSPKDPDINELYYANAKVEVKHTKLLKTEKGESEEGQILKGLQLVVEGNVKQTIKYMSEDKNKSIVFSEYLLPFTTFIALGENFDSTKWKIDTYIEDIYVLKLSKRKIYQSIMFLIDVNNL